MKKKESISKRLRVELEPSDTLEIMLVKLQATFGDRVSITYDGVSDNIRLDNDSTYVMAYHDKEKGFILTQAGELMLGIAQTEGANNVNVGRIKEEIY